MDQTLIDRLWERTLRDEQKILSDISREGSHTLPEHVASRHHSVWPAEYYFDNGRKQMHLTFHLERHNQVLHCHDFFEIIYVCRGCASGTVNGVEMTFPTGSVCIMNPKAVHAFTDYRDGSDLILNILLSKELFQKSMFCRLIEDPVLNSFFTQYWQAHDRQDSFMLFPNLEGRFNDVVNLLLAEFLNDQQFSQTVAESLLTVLLAILLRTYRKDHPAETKDSQFVEIYDYLHRNFATADLQSTVDHFHYHPKYFSTLIHRQTGKTFTQILTEIKLQNALNYLIYTDYSVERISELVGYQDKSQFYRVFREKYGMSPAQYKTANA